MAADSSRQSIYLNTSRRPRQLPALPRLQMPNNDQRSPIQGPSRCKSPSTPLVFEFPPEYSVETPNTNFDFDEFGRVGELEQQRSPRSPSFYARSSPRSPKTPNDILHSPGRKSPFPQFNDLRENSKTESYPTTDRCKSFSSSSYSQVSPKPYDRRRNSCFGNLKSPMSPTIPIVIPSSPDCEIINSKVEQDSETDERDVFEEIDEHKNKIRGKTSSLESPLNKREISSEGNDRRSRQRSRSIKMDRHVNKSQGCLDEVGRGHCSGSDEYSSHDRSVENMSRRSTSDLTDLYDADTETTTLMSSPRRRSSVKSGLAYLASRRSSRDSQCSNISNVSKEDVGPLNFSSHPRGRQRRTSNFLEIPVVNHIKPRVHSLPEKAFNPRDSDDLYKLRAFSITHKGVVNQGDCIRSRRSRSNTSVNSSRNSNVSGERSPFDGSCCSGQGASSNSDIEEISKYRVVMLGESGVGKTSLVSQFTTSEYINTYDASLDEEFGEKNVSVLLDGQESEVVFIDHPYVEMSVENSLSTYEPHGCIVVYSVVSRTSFQTANEILSYLWQQHYTKERSVILVGNKSDLARSRIISENEGKQLATSHECKFIETSSGIKHNVDELLVGILKQIRLKESRNKKLKRQNSKSNKIMSKLQNSKTVLNLKLARDILNKMCLKDSKSKSCENLHIL